MQQFWLAGDILLIRDDSRHILTRDQTYSHSHKLCVDINPQM